ncbi:hypothetical protein RBSH_00952 [Rhodopirellula baltica SH28]|uniref:Uncharacterized protein n=1 Tax=Rhodopirellula baltica SH28 TaxID=993517 RepID=K5DMY7_RHOBT|nr:hypothetical protein [Rhodopirellula baltica]EKK03823.1 hypothetical protein RBSH_00952 [Rhodopirellula baltica SH28]
MLHSKGAVPKYRKHSSGQARVTINGRDYYRCLKMQATASSTFPV